MKKVPAQQMSVPGLFFSVKKLRYRRIVIIV